jgi:rhodanese-related sulfurtransferase
MRRTIAASLAILALVLSAAVIWAAEEKSGEQYPNISIQDLKSAMNSKTVTLLDANGTDSYKDGHIPGAIDFETNTALEKVLPKDKSALIVAYCGGPQCMMYKAAAEKAVALGYTNVKHLTAGISGWKEAGEKVDSGS